MTLVDDGIELLEVIGSGGFGTVHRAHQPAFGRDVAVKLLSTRLTDDDVRARFDRECRAVGLLSGHPNIVTVHASGIDDDDRPYLVMELLPGGTFADRVRAEGGLAWPEVVDVGIAMASALATAHERGVLHRDVKPANVLLSAWDEPKLADFGVARIAGEQLTRSQAVTASLLYAAPEVLAGRPPTVASDVYALASTMHTLLAGRPAHAGDPDTDASPLAIINRVATQDPPPLRRHGVPGPLADAIALGMARDPADRPKDAPTFRRLLVEAAGAAGRPADGAGPAGVPDETRRVAPPGPSAPTPARPVVHAAPDWERPLALEPTPPTATGAQRRLMTIGTAAAVGVGAVAVLASMMLGAGDEPDDEPTVLPTTETSTDEETTVEDPTDEATESAPTDEPTQDDPTEQTPLEEAAPLTTEQAAGFASAALIRDSDLAGDLEGAEPGDETNTYDVALCEGQDVTTDVMPLAFENRGWVDLPNGRIGLQQVSAFETEAQATTVVEAIRAGIDVCRGEPDALLDGVSGASDLDAFVALRDEFEGGASRMVLMQDGPLVTHLFFVQSAGADDGPWLDFAAAGARRLDAVFS